MFKCGEFFFSEKRWLKKGITGMKVRFGMGLYKDVLDRSNNQCYQCVVEASVR